MNGTYSPAGTAVFSGASLLNQNAETDQQRKKRLAAIANSSAARAMSSSAGNALASGYGAGLFG
jgi:hypothetical protein